MTDVYRMAGRNIEITSLYPDVHAYCAAYRAEGTPDFSVAVAGEDIDFERVRSAREDAREGRVPRNWSDGYLEELAVYRKIAETMPAYDTILFHGSAVAVDGAAYLFTARSGTGKSTHARLWRELFGERAVMINDDKPLIRVTDTGGIVYGTPYDGKHRLSRNTAVPIRALCALRRAEENSIRRLEMKEAFPLLLQQTYHPIDGEAMAKTLTLLEQLAALVPTYRLDCNMSIAAARLAYETMSG